jgi:paraquat-inducible protein B
MSKPANPKMIGAFVLGAMALIVLGVIYFGGARWFAATQRYVMYFGGSVNGLNVGSPVTWRGVPIGQVKDINLLYDAEKLKFFIEVIVEINTTDSVAIGNGGTKVAPQDEVDKLIAKGLRAQLVQQSFVTGQLAVQVSMFPGTPANLLGLNPDLKEVPTVPSTFAQIEDAITSIVAKLEGIDLTAVIRDLEAAATALRDVVAAPELKQAFVDAQQVLKDTRTLIQGINERFGPLADDLTATMKTADGAMIEAKQTLAQARQAFSDVRGSLERAETLLTTADRVIRPGSPIHFELISALREVSAAARSLGSLAQTLERNPDALLFGRRKPGGQ